jgi:leucyl-tRNA synthetase
MLRQWFFNIRKYADEMLDGLDKLPKWNDHVKELQRGWIGRSQGANIKFNLVKASNTAEVLDATNVFTTRPDTIFGVSFIALAHDNPLVKPLLDQDKDNWIDQNAYERYLEQVRLQGWSAKNQSTDLSSDNDPGL